MTLERTWIQSLNIHWIGTLIAVIGHVTTRLLWPVVVQFRWECIHTSLLYARIWFIAMAALNVCVYVLYFIYTIFIFPFNSFNLPRLYCYPWINMDKNITSLKRRSTDFVWNHPLALIYFFWNCVHTICFFILLNVCGFYSIAQEQQMYISTYGCL